MFLFSRVFLLIAVDVWPRRHLNLRQRYLYSLHFNLILHCAIGMLALYCKSINFSSIMLEYICAP